MKPAEALEIAAHTVTGGKGQESPLVKTLVMGTGFLCLAAVLDKLAACAEGCLTDPLYWPQPLGKGPFPGSCLQLVGFMGMQIMHMAIEMPLLLELLLELLLMLLEFKTESNNKTCSADKMTGKGLFSQTRGTHPFSSSSSLCFVAYKVFGVSIQCFFIES